MPEAKVIPERFVARPYMGIPFRAKGRDEKGCDCYGWIRLIYLRELGIDLPSLTSEYRTTRDALTIESVMERYLGTGAWDPIPKGKERAFDVVTMIIDCEARQHVGIVTSPGMMAHLERNTTPAKEPMWGIKWKDRIRGVYRYQGPQPR